MEIGELQKGKDKIIIALKEFNGKEYIDIRTHFENSDGDWIPTKKGVTFSPENLDEMIELLMAAKKKMSER
ncbi:MAG TPA: transcriptional coactivator p15/PC4 family protein [Syntrophorhabdus sp.]|jgi:hypothetical protein|nr:transcriptional coactivator p15/PC4 family protein [Syntrophorhabdus sp.]MDI9557086.1 transcriptional coactivator p15/PC4 family protein [Pseudomonadota bacterium]HOD77415.1 transcriptional coactivator p15/PC4 family protein [Syntrophorhabdus sp.]HQG24949.1 transcriptional coactivator p15/PC4 family protein [Syntrophorhabdus sp.]HQI96860.1 transcriptional coactivator p15/PC4 family protein [Syntrophorhabdus sp.]